MRKPYGGILTGRIIVLLSIFLICNSCVPSVKSHSSISSSTDVSRRDTILIEDMKFQPEKITVNKGDTVVWINQDMVAHCVTATGDKSWTSGLIPARSSWKMAVTQGTGYFCAIHQVMKGEIVVK